MNLNMAEENKEKKKTEEKNIVETSKQEERKAEIKEEKKIEPTKEEKQKNQGSSVPSPLKVEEKKEKRKKEEAVVNAKDLAISPKHGKFICKFIKGKEIEKAISELEKVLTKKIAIPMTGEIPHRKKGVIGRYPQKACKIFIKILKSLQANSQVNGLENPYIYFAKADIASRPHKKAGLRFKRTNVVLITKEIKNKEKK